MTDPQEAIQQGEAPRSEETSLSQYNFSQNYLENTLPVATVVEIVSEDVGLGPNGSTPPLPPPPPPPTAAEKTKLKKKDENKKGNKEKQSAAAQGEKAAKKRGHRG